MEIQFLSLSTSAVSLSRHLSRQPQPQPTPQPSASAVSLSRHPTVSSVVQFYNCVNRLGTARIQLQEAPGDQIPLLEAGSHLKPYSCSILQLCKPLGNR